MARDARSRNTMWMVAVAAAGLAGGCGDEDPVGRGGAGGAVASSGVETSSTTGAGGDAPAGGGGTSASSGSGGEPTSTRPGEVRISNHPTAEGDGAEYGSASAFFFDVQGSSGCTQFVEGACSHFHCGLPGVLVSQSAGTIEVNGTTPPIVLEPASPGDDYLEVQSEAPYWAEGDVVTVSASGAAVPAFEVTLTAPTRATITEPVLSGDLVVSREDGMEIAWTAEGAGGALRLIIITYGSDAGTDQLVCTFPVEQGSATIPASILTRLPATDQARIALGSTAEAQLTAGDFDVTVALSHAAHAAGAQLGLASAAAILE